MKYFTSKSAFILLILSAIMQNGYSQESINQSVRLMFYNVENLFDIYDDPLKDDNEFLPGGIRRWNYSRYNRKINGLYKTIVAAGDWNPPDVVALCEVENKKVLEDLVMGTYLSQYNYGIIHEESPDLRGIDVCIIYRKESIDVINFKYWIPSVIEGNEFISRSVLYTKVRIGSDTLHIIANHWPSRRGGVLSAESDRKLIAAMVKEKLDSLYNSAGSNVKIIICGDLNCSPDDPVVNMLDSPCDSCFQIVNLSKAYSKNGEGTYRYMGIWEMIDQMLASDALLNSGNGLSTNEKLFKVFKPDFLLIKDPKYPGLTPNSTFRGYNYRGGYSDHLPVLLDIYYAIPDQ